MLICIHKDLHFISNTNKHFDNVVYQNAVCHISRYRKEWINKVACCVIQ